MPSLELKFITDVTKKNFFLISLGLSLRAFQVSCDQSRGKGGNPKYSLWLTRGGGGYSK